MIGVPEGIEYWYQDSNGNWMIQDIAPDWAKEEFRNVIALIDDPIND